MTMPYLLLIVAIVSETIATTCMKLSDGFTKLGPSIVTVIGYCISLYCLSLSLRTLPTGIAYAIWCGLGIVLITGIAWAWQGQKLDGAAVAGIALIMAGVMMLSVFSKSAPH